MRRAALKRAAIVSTGRAFPRRVVPNTWFYEELGLDTNEAWIRERTGIVERRLADVASGETTASLAAEASRIALSRADRRPEDVDAILVATITPDFPVTATAAIVQSQLGASRAWGYDLVAACSGWVFGLAQAAALIRAGMARSVLVCGSEVMSSILDYQDRNTSIIFGDGAGAALVEAAERGGGELVDFRMHIDGSGRELLYQPAGGSVEPASELSVRERRHFVFQDGRAVFKHAVTRISEVILELLDGSGLKPADVDLVVPHQANIRIIEACGRRLGIPMERIVVTVEQWANTTAATIPTSLDKAIEDGRIGPGSTVVFASFGAGFTWGAALVRY
jgi:3-oxoacyl-[acyl-carrier-protein] synthase-3